MNLITLALTLAVTPAAPESWPATPEGFSSFGVAVAGGHVYVYGGHTAKTHQYSTGGVTGKFRRVKADGTSTAWEELPAATPLQGLAIVAHKGKVIRVGGMQPRNAPGEKADNHSVAEVASYDPAAKKWTPLPSLPVARSSHDAVVIGDKLYVVGGWKMNGRAKGSDWQDKMLVLDLSAKVLAWKEIEQPFERRALQATVFEGKMVVAGGLDSENEISMRLDAYDPPSGKWSRLPDVPGKGHNGFNPALAVRGGRLYLNPPDGVVYRLAAAKDGWEKVGALREGRVAHRMTDAGPGLLVIGGASRAGNLKLVEAVGFTKAEPVASAKSKSPEGQEFCPIMTRVPVGNDSKEVVYEGVTIRICCSTCVRKFKAEPEAYLLPSLLPQLAGKKLPPRKIAQVYCPVNPDKVVCSLDPSTTYKGATVYFFSETAKKKFLASPEKYADAKILPQLRAGR